MSNQVKIILSSVIMTVAVSLLFMVIPITGAFIVSYSFTLIAIIGIALSLLVFGKSETTKAPQGLAFIHTVGVYSVISIIFSFFAYVLTISTKWTIVIHTAILAVFVIRIIALIGGSEYINKTDSKAEEKHKEFQKEKESYWR